MQKNYVGNRAGHLESLTTSLHNLSNASRDMRAYRSFGWSLLLVALLSLMATRANLLALSDITAGLFIFGSTLLLLKQKIAVTPRTIFFILGMLLLFVENYFFTVTTFDLKIYAKLLALCISVIFMIQLTGSHFLTTLQKITIALCVLSWPFYLWQIIHVSSLTSFGTSVQQWLPWIRIGRIYQDTQAINILIHTIETTENFRNSGAFWEPGGFASFLNLALVLHLIQNNFRFDRHTRIILLTLLTTFSTTGYVVLFLILVFTMANRIAGKITPAKLAIRLFLIITLGLLFFYIFYAIPIFREKIDNQISAQQILIGDIDFDNPNYSSLGRFGSMIVDLRSVQDRPLFGRGYSDTEFRSQFENYNFTNGLTSFIGHFGLVGFAWLLISTYASGKSIFRQYNSQARFPVFITLIVLTIAFSNPILLTPLLLYFQLHFLTNS
ncbi:MAG: O-antigen ligase family protein [Flavobacteriales bacterium]|jgi:hypothetical protein